eukprot:2688024-Amphidinium_carterae.1
MERLDEGGRTLDGRVRALPGLPEGGIPPLQLGEHVVLEPGVDVEDEMQLGEEGLCPSSEARVKALPGRVEETVHPQTPHRGKRSADFHSPQFGG